MLDGPTASGQAAFRTPHKHFVSVINYCLILLGHCFRLWLCASLSCQVQHPGHPMVSAMMSGQPLLSPRQLEVSVMNL